MRRALLTALLVALPLALSAALLPACADGRRVALVIGNSRYANVPALTNPANDAKLIGATLALKQIGFILIGGGPQLDLDKAGFDRAVRAFGQALQGADIALFYYAGHGMQVSGTNWLVPVDAKLTRPQDLEFVMTDAEAVLRQMEGAGTRLNVVILDACRDNPFAAGSARGIGHGLAQMQAPEGTLISYATQPGAEAEDGDGKDSPYTTALSEAIQQPGLDIFQMFNRVGVQVKRATGGRQVPWVSNSPIEGQFYFAGPGAQAAATQVAAAQPATPPRDAAGGGDYEKGKAAYEAKDYAEALRWLRPAAEHGSAAAQDKLGQMYRHGWGVPQDYAEALRWYRKSAEQGNSEGENNLGYMYQQGWGVARDYTEAAAWYRKSAARNNAFAQNNLGVLYRNGWGVPKDVAEARRWFKLSADQGHKPAELNLTTLGD